MKIATFFLQTVTVLIGIAALAFLLWEPNVEGRNAHATLTQVYFHDPFLAYAYAGSIPFFVALGRAFRVLGHIRRGAVFSQASVKAVRVIKHCAMATIGLVAVGEILLVLFTTSDDRTGGFFIGLLVVFGAAVAAAVASVTERVLQDGVAMKAGTP